MSFRLFIIIKLYSRYTRIRNSLDILNLCYQHDVRRKISFQLRYAGFLCHRFTAFVVILLNHLIFLLFIESWAYFNIML